jgi:plasmid stabilization system protein ParE
MDCKVILSSLFLSDLREIVEYLAESAGPEVARRLGNQLLDRALEIGRHPHAGQPARQCPGVRKVLHHAYLIYYEIDEEARTVWILRAWHGARDPKTLRLKS